ncbi:MAG: hypothetical protein ABW024_06790 [Microbacterium sp.]
MSAAVLIPNLIVIGLGVEDFPFTTAPMFAQYVGPETTLYSFRMEGVRDGVSEPLPIQETNLGELEVQRQLASWFYRPMTDTSPFRDLTSQSDDPEVFAQRMSEFFAPIVDFLRDQRSVEFDEVVLYVDVSDSSGDVLDSELVGRYDTSTDAYTQLYEAGR